MFKSEIFYWFSIILFTLYLRKPFFIFIFHYSKDNANFAALFIKKTKIMEYKEMTLDE
jgi:hypothetical protein